jgi:dihydroorotate dehydrogenase electron transfer subunit
VTARQLQATVADVTPVGAYHLLTLRQPSLGAGFRPGQFAAIAVGGKQTAMLLRRCFSIHHAEGDAMQLVVAERGPGTRWLVRRVRGDVIDIITPLGRPFPLPPDRANPDNGSDAADAPHGLPRPVRGPREAGHACVLVGGGYGSAPLFALADRLRARGHPVHMVLGAATTDRLFGVDEAKALSDSVIVTTEDGSAGRPGWVSDVLPGVLAETGARSIYACGPMGMLRAVSEIATAAGATAHCAVEESMACGIGICMTCVLPVVGDDGRTRMTRSCTEGPVFDGTRVRWDAVGTVPADCVGATPAPGGFDG